MLSEQAVGCSYDVSCGLLCSILCDVSCLFVFLCCAVSVTSPCCAHGELGMILRIRQPTVGREPAAPMMHETTTHDHRYVGIYMAAACTPSWTNSTKPQCDTIPHSTCCSITLPEHGQQTGHPHTHHGDVTHAMLLLLRTLCETKRAMRVTRVRHSMHGLVELLLAVCCARM